MSATTAFSRQELSLESLADLDCDELEAIYRQGRMPARFSALDGSPAGRMLAIRHLDRTPLAGPIAALAGMTLFPWEGKTFKATSPTTGTGSNRVKLVGRFQCVPFETMIQPSQIDGEDCVCLDYDLPGNPFFIRRIRDELREVAPGLFLGPATIKTGATTTTLVLWFAIDTRA